MAAQDASFRVPPEDQGTAELSRGIRRLERPWPIAHEAARSFRKRAMTPACRRLDHERVKAGVSEGSVLVFVLGELGTIPPCSDRIRRAVDGMGPASSLMDLAQCRRSMAPALMDHPASGSCRRERHARWPAGGLDRGEPGRVRDGTRSAGQHRQHEPAMQADPIGQRSSWDFRDLRTAVERLLSGTAPRPLNGVDRREPHPDD